MNILEVQDLCKTYGKGEAAVQALRHATFSVRKGEFIAIIGESGSGKSTLLNVVGALDKATSGKVWIDGQDIFSMPEKKLTVFRRQHIGFIFQSFNLIPELNVEQNITFPLLLDYKRPDQRFVNELLNVLGLTERRHHLPSQLSGGQQQRVAIARAIVNEPEVLLLDEPTTGLDPNQIVEIRELIKNIGREKTVIMSSHILAEIEATCDRVLIINKGKIVADGTSAELRNKSDKGKLLKICIQGGEDEDIYNELALIPELENIISSTPHHFEIQCERATEIEKKIFDICCQNNWYISEMTPVETRLEDIFRQVTKN